MNVTGLKRNSGSICIDKFYTKPDVAKICIDRIISATAINSNDTILEPSAGNGVFIDPIKKITKNAVFIDILPDHPEIQQQDYLDSSFQIKQNKGSTVCKLHVIGNPPFGRGSSLAIKFIKRSCEIADTISFILPRSFKKKSMEKYFDKYFHKIDSFDLPKNSFRVPLGRNQFKDHDVPCVFQIYTRKTMERPTILQLTPNKFSFVKKDQDPDISFRRVGGKAGEINVNDIQSKSIQSHYFIKLENELSPELLEKLSSLTFGESDFTVGPKSISKQELIIEFNRIL